MIAGHHLLQLYPRNQALARLGSRCDPPLQYAGLRRLLDAPQPAERVGEEGAPVFAVVPAVPEFEAVIVIGESQGGGHVLIRNRPAPVDVIQVTRAILQEDADRLPLSLADQGRVDI